MSAVHEEHSRGPTVSMLVARAITHAAGKHAHQVAAAGGASVEGLDEGDGFIELDAEEAMWREALRLTGDPQLGLHAAHRLCRGAFGALEYAVRSSGTLTEGLQRLVRFVRLLHGEDLFHFEADERGGVLTYASPHERSADLVEVIGDFGLAAVLLEIARDATGLPLATDEARLARRPPRSTAPYRAVFGESISFEAEAWSLRFSSDVLATPMRAADPALCAVLESYLERDLGASSSHESFLARLRMRIADRLADGDPTIGGVAETLGVSERTLQRRMEELETSYQAELATVRRDLAQKLLRQPDVSIAGVALVLGYSDVSSFHRAFRRWTGTTPARFKRPDAN